MLESKLEAKCVEYARERGGWIGVKIVDRVGIPDRVFLGPAGEVFFVEFKQRGRKPSPKQRLAIANLRARGFTVEVVTSHATFKRLLEQENA
jgi:hypothetical protein